MGVSGRLAALLAAGFVAAAPAQAEPAYFRTPDVPLPVRDAPDGATVAELAPATVVEATGERGGWIRVPLAETDAWAARDALRPVDVPRLEGSALPDGLLCTGTEPFWSLRLSSAGIVYEEPGAPARPFGLLSAAPADGALRTPVLVTLIQDRESMLAIVRPAACSDGMSDRTQPWQADVVLQRPGTGPAVLALRSGCCRLPPEPR